MQRDHALRAYSRWQNLALVAVVAFCGWQLFVKSGCRPIVFRPTAVARATDAIDLEHDPVQTTDGLPAPIEVERPQGKFTIQPVARYVISGIVVSTKRYSLDWQSFLVPVDVGIVWGDTVKPEHLQLMSFDHGNRFLHWRYRGTLKLPLDYLVSHASNNHVIPASPTLARAIDTLKAGEKATLEGYLVNVDGTAEGRQVSWRTSLVRNDREGGACEVMYLTKLRIGDEVFE